MPSPPGDVTRFLLAWSNGDRDALEGLVPVVYRADAPHEPLLEQGRLVELRGFGGLTVEEIAEAMGISPATVKRQWTVATASLLCDLEGEARL